MNRPPTQPLLFALTGLLAASCAGDPQPASPNKTDARAAHAKGSRTMVEVTDSESSERFLVPATVRVDLTGTGMSAAKLPEGGVYLRCSGPPGGPLGLEVSACSVPHDLEQGVQKAFEKRSYVAGQSGTFPLNGTECKAISFTSGKDHARAHHLRVLIKTSDRPTQDILLDFWRAAGKNDPAPAPAEFLKDPTYGSFLKSVSIQVAPH